MKNARTAGRSPKKKKAGTDSNPPRMNAKGKICSWNSNSVDGLYLKALVERGMIDGLTAGEVQQVHEMFAKYENSTLSSALINVRNAFAREVAIARRSGSSVVPTHSNLRRIEDDGSYVSALDPDYVDLSDGVSRLGFGNDAKDEDDALTYDTFTIGYQSNAFREAKHRGEPVKQLGPTIRGNTMIGMPYMMDIWEDTAGKKRCSIQIHLPSGTDFYKSVTSRVSTSQKEFVVLFPMSKYMSRADFAFQTFFLDCKQLTEPHPTVPQPTVPQPTVLFVMKNHPKKIARMKTVSKIVGRSKVADFYYEQRIPLPKQCMHQLAGKEDGDAFFYDKRFVQYPDGSIHMHVELLAKVVDSYCPEELESKPTTQVASAILGQGVTSMDTESFVGGATILQNDFVASNLRTRSVKRTCTAPIVTDPSAQQLTHEDARREALRVLQLAEAQHQFPHQQNHHHQQRAHHHHQQQQQALGEDDEDCDDFIYGDPAGTGPSEAVQLKQASSLQQAAAAKGGHPL